MHLLTRSSRRSRISAALLLALFAAVGVRLEVPEYGLLTVDGRGEKPVLSVAELDA